jgi:hypothetical protein
MKRNHLLSISIGFSVSLSTLSFAQQPIRFDKGWWDSLNKNEHWDFIYGFTDCGKALQSGLNTQQYESFVTAHITSTSDSAPYLIALALSKVKALPQQSGGEVWKVKHGFNDGDLWGDDAGEGRAWVEGYLACENRSVDLPSVDRYVHLMLKYYSNPKRHLDKLADVLEPLLHPKTPVTHP